MIRDYLLLARTLSRKVLPLAERSVLILTMLRKGGEPAEFVYGLSASSLEPPEHLQDEEDMPLRFVSVQLQLPESIKELDIGTSVSSAPFAVDFASPCWPRDHAKDSASEALGFRRFNSGLWRCFKAD